MNRIFWLCASIILTFPALQSPAHAQGDPEACENPGVANIPQLLPDATLDNENDCFAADPGRLIDVALLELDEQASFTVAMESTDFQVLTGINTNEETPQLVGLRGNSQLDPSSAISFSYVLPAGSYRLFATSIGADPDTPPTGEYSHQLTADAVPQTGCTLPTFVTVGSNPVATLSNTDCIDDTLPDSGDVQRYKDRYAIFVPAGETVYVTASVENAFRFQWGIADGPINVIQQDEMAFAAGGQDRTFAISSESDATHVMTLMTAESESSGYSMLFSDEAPDPLGLPEACETPAALTLGASIDGSLNSTFDCYVASPGRLIDRFEMVLAQEQTAFNLNVVSADFQNLIGVNTITDPSLSVGFRAVPFLPSNTNASYLLPAGTYSAFVTGLETDPDNPSSGDYSLSVGEMAEPQQNCTAPTFVIVGSEAEASISDTDCVDDTLDDSGDVTRYKDSYEISVPAGETVYVTVGADFDYRFQWGTRVSPSEITLIEEMAFVANMQERTFTVTADSNANHVMTVMAADDAGIGNYFMAFRDEAPDPLGDADACENTTALALGDNLNGALNSIDDCFNAVGGRLADRFELVLDQEQTAFNLNTVSADFQNLTGVSTTADPAQTVGARGVPFLPSNTNVSYLLPAGTYRAYVTGLEANVQNPASGDYSLSVGEMVEPQQNCTAPTFVVVGSEADASLSVTDCVDDTLDDAGDVTRYKDNYEIFVPGGETVYVTLGADFDYRFQWGIRNSPTEIVLEEEMTLVLGMQERTFAVTAENNANHVLTVMSANEGGTGSYFMAFSNEAPEPLGDDEACSNRPDIAMADIINGSLSSTEDCFNDTVGKLIDGFALTLEEQTAFNLNLDTADFQALVTVTTAADPAAYIGGRAVPFLPSSPNASFVLPAGNYYVNALSFDGNVLNPPTGDYTLTVGEMAEPQTGCTQSAFVVLGVDVGASLNDSDCVDDTLADADTVTRYTDSYSLFVPAGQTAYVILEPEFAARFQWGSEPVNQTVSVAAEADGFLSISSGGSGTMHTFYVMSGADEAVGDYMITVTSENPAPPPPPAPDPEPDPEDQLDEETGALNDEIDNIDIPTEGEISDEVVDAVNNAVDQAAQIAENAAEQVATGNLSTTAALGSLTSTNKALSKAGTATQGGATVNSASAVKSLGNVSSVLSALATRGNLSAEEKVQVNTVAKETLTNSGNLISANTTAEEVENVLSATASVLNSALATGAALDEDLAAVAVQVSLKAVSRLLPDFAETVGQSIDVNDLDQVRQLMAEPVILESAINNSIAVNSSIDIDESTASDELAAQGVNTDAVSRILAGLRDSIANPDGVSVSGDSTRTATTSLLNALLQAFGGSAEAISEGGLSLLAASDDFTVSVNPVTGGMQIGNSLELFSVASSNIRLVSEAVPAGVSYLPDGRAVAVSDGMAIELYPAPVDVIGFAAAIEKLGYEVSFRKNGSFSLATGNGEQFSGTFAFDNIAGVQGSCGAIGFAEPDTRPESPDYAFLLRCNNGIEQRILPMVGDSAFYSAVSKARLTVRTDRNTGVISIPGIGRLKPSFFVQPLTAEDETFRTANASNGVAFRAADFNGDGVVDYELLFASGKQILHGLP